MANTRLKVKHRIKSTYLYLLKVRTEINNVLKFKFDTISSINSNIYNN